MSAAEAVEESERHAADDREGEIAALAADGFLPRRCTSPGCTSEALIEPRQGLMEPNERTSDRAAVWECRECYAVRRMPWRTPRTVVTR